MYYSSAYTILCTYLRKKYYLFSAFPLRMRKGRHKQTNFPCFNQAAGTSVGKLETNIVKIILDEMKPRADKMCHLCQTARELCI